MGFHPLCPWEDDAGASGDDAVTYSWAQQLAKLHYDVFLMDLQGSGLTTGCTAARTGATTGPRTAT